VPRVAAAAKRKPTCPAALLLLRFALRHALSHAFAYKTPHTDPTKGSRASTKQQRRCERGDQRAESTARYGRGWLKLVWVGLKRAGGPRQLLSNSHTPAPSTRCPLYKQNQMTQPAPAASPQQPPKQQQQPPRKQPLGPTPSPFKPNPAAPQPPPPAPRPAPPQTPMATARRRRRRQ